MNYSDTAPNGPDGRPHLRIHRRISGTAIIAGLIFAFAVQIVLGLFGSALGFSMVDASNPDAAPKAGNVAVGAAMWVAVSMLIAVFYGAFLSARVSGNPVRTDGILHGLIVWAASVLIAACLMTSAIGGVFSGTYGVFNGPHHAYNAMAAGMKMARPQTEAMELINGDKPSPTMTQFQAQADIAAQATILGRDGDGAAAARARIIADLETQNVSPEDAEARVQDMQAKMATAKEKDRQVADAAAHATAKAALAAGVALLLGAFVSCLGGALGALRAAESLERHHLHHTQQTTTTTN